MDFIVEGVVPDLLHIKSVVTIILVIEGDCDNILGKEVEERSWFWEVGGGGGDGHCFVGGGGGGLYSVFYTPFFKHWKTLAPFVVMFTAIPQRVKYCWITFKMWYVSFFFSLKIDDQLEYLSDMAR